MFDLTGSGNNLTRSVTLGNTNTAPTFRRQNAGRLIEAESNTTSQVRFNDYILS